MFGQVAAAHTDSPPPRQKPTDPTPLPSTPGWEDRKSAAPHMSLSACSIESAIIFCSASLGWPAVSPL